MEVVANSMKRFRYNKRFLYTSLYSPDLPTCAHWFFVSLSSLILRSHRLEAVARDLFIRPRTAGRLITLGHPPAVSVLHTRDVASCARHMTRRRIACLYTAAESDHRNHARRSHFCVHGGTASRDSSIALYTKLNCPSIGLLPWFATAYRLPS